MKNNRGSSLIETLIVIGFMGVLTIVVLERIDDLQRAVIQGPQNTGKVAEEPYVANFGPEGSWVVERTPNAVKGTSLQHLLVKRTTDGQVFAAVVVPPCSVLNVGTSVEVVEVDYSRYQNGKRDGFLIVTQY